MSLGAGGDHRSRCCLFGTTELPDEVGVAHWIVYVWMSILSIVIMALYTSVMSQILLLNTIKVDTFAKAYDQARRSASLAM
jgi:hypothetical protein